MIEVQDRTESYREQFKALQERVTGTACSWLEPIRRSAMARFGELGFPTTKHEEWRYTNVSPIADTVFEPAGLLRPSITAAQLAPYTFDPEGATLLVFVNGRFAPALSSLSGLPADVAIGSLAEGLARGDAALEPHLARHAGYHEQPFTAWNTAFIEDGAMISLPRGAVVQKPIQILHLMSTSGAAVVAHPRTLILAGPNSQATVVETYAGLDGGGYFTNAVSEIVAQENAVLDHYRVVREADGAYHVSTLQLHQERSSNVTSSSVCLGGALVRNDINVLLDGEGCECTLNGFYFAIGDEHVDNHLRVEHAKPHCDSREYFKGVLDDKGSGVFSGRIIVHEGAQKTDAKQTNMSLLLSKSARVQSKPQLEIFADDVKCTHGATIGQVDEEAVFYLRSRGISEKAARSLMVYAFARENLDRIRVEPLRKQMEALLLARLPQGELLRGER